jgi:tetratricopeptide (TPR) repeat protein
VLRPLLLTSGIAVLAASRPGVAQLRVTTGAAPGYVDDTVCAGCHEGIAQSYREVGMSRSFSRPRREAAVEDFTAARFTHIASHRTYEMFWRGERLIFRRHQLDAEGRERNVLELPVDWILGSGNHARTYLYRTPSGELFQLPVAWYAEDRRLAMAPGYDRADHQEVGRPVRRECMFCHNAYPEVAAGSDARGAPQVYPDELPEGTGCQRCHGPGGEHASLALRGATADEARATIVNPARLAPERRDDVCYQCHLQPSVAIPGTRRFGRADYSFRPGQALGDYLVPTDIDSGLPDEDRFEINHHPYRLRSSRCALASGSRLSCLTCHDPHRKVPAADRAAHYRSACLSCHENADLAAKHPPALIGHGSVLAADCVSCHMPRRRPQDVVHTVMTDHRIGVYRDPARLTAPFAETEPQILDLRLYGLPPAPQGAEAELYRALAATSAGVASAQAALDRLSARLKPEAADPYLELAPALLRRGDLAGAERALASLRTALPDNPRVLDWQAALRARQGRAAEAEALWRDVARRLPRQAETRFNLGRLLLARGQWAEAREAFEAAAMLRPNLVPAWHRLAETRRLLGDAAGEIDALRRALAVDPGESQSYVALAIALARADARKEAEEWLRFGKIVARNGDRMPARPSE